MTQLRLLPLEALSWICHVTDKAGMAQQDGERRKHPRRPVFLKCRIEGTTVGGAMLLTDLSEGGCFIATGEAVPVGSQVTLHVMMGTTEVPLIGRVVRAHHGRGFGVELNVAVLSAHARQALEQVLLQSALA